MAQVGGTAGLVEERQEIADRQRPDPEFGTGLPLEDARARDRRPAKLRAVRAQPGLKPLGQVGPDADEFAERDR